MSKPRPHIRDATPADATPIANMGTHIFTSTFGHSLNPIDLAAYLGSAYTPASIGADILDPMITTIVACDDQDRILGFSQLTQGTVEPCVADAERPVELQRLYVDPNSHGMGIGKALVRRLEDLARARGFKTLWLGVWEENFVAQKVYARMGFEKVGNHDFKMGECVQTDWIMSKVL